MPRYRAEIHGENFLVDVDARVSKRGFITFRVVEAEDPQGAEQRAVQIVRETPQLRDLVRNDKEDPPTMTVTELVAFDDGAAAEAVPTGLIWYDDSPKRWWQFWK